MAGSSIYLQNKLVNHSLGISSYTPPTNLYLGLWTSSLTSASSGGTAGEVSGGAYARATVNGNVGAPSGGVIQNNATISFPQATGNWGAVTNWGIFDGNSGTSSDNLLFFGSGLSLSPISSDVVDITSGNLTISIVDTTSPSTEGASIYLQNALLNHVFGLSTYTMPTTISLGLFTSALTAASVAPFGSTEVSTSGTGYTRSVVLSGGTNIMASASSGVSGNSTTLTLPTVGSTPWGTILGVGLFDSSTVNAGNLLYFSVPSSGMSGTTGTTFLYSGNSTPTSAALQVTFS